MMEGNVAGEIPCSSIAVDAVLRIGTAGLIWGACSASHDSIDLGLKGLSRASFVAKSVGRYGFQWGFFAALFSFTSCAVRRYRRQEDWVNGLAGGMVAGAAIAAGTRNWKQVAGVSGLVCALYQAADDRRTT
ncbi:OLC1v1004336C1 [Oldenlandia corymbosa var. corymbosa]|uniref:OLC1v1004336C1 n=1 Tax=Oldenlandia corymbosa var. corymbosa TaxID=529605 RepID=A0AAV1DC17_OLDCO|nr:OLC1v1004336C1 [Oldenlandia corymbosa var. corymbosa]